MAACAFLSSAQSRNQVEHHHPHSYAALVFTQVLLSQQPPKTQLHKGRMPQKEMYLELVVNAVFSRCHRSLCFLWKLKISCGTPCELSMIPQIPWHTQFGNCRLCRKVMHAYESNLGVSDPRSMSFFFFNVSVLVVNINFHSV